MLLSVGVKLFGELRKLGAFEAGPPLGVVVGSCAVLATGVAFILVNVPRFRMRYWAAIYKLRQQRDRGGAALWPSQRNSLVQQTPETESERASPADARGAAHSESPVREHDRRRQLSTKLFL